MLNRYVLSFVSLALLGSTISSQAATVLLDFQDLTNAQFVPSNYGTTAELTVSFITNVPQSLGQRASNFGTPEDLGIVELGNTFPTQQSEIIFTPAPGFEVSLVSFNRSRGTNTLNTASFRLLDPSETEVFTLDIGNNPLNKVLVPVNSDFYAGPITFQYGTTESGSGATRVDDILLEVRAIPEVSTFAMMLGVAGITLLGVRSRRGWQFAQTSGR